MKSSFVALTVSLLASGALAQQLTINTPASLVQCQPQLLQWSGGQGPYFLSVQPGSQPGASALEDLGQQDGTSFTWLVNIAQGQSVGFLLRDSTGATANSAPVTIQNSSESGCVGQAASSGGGSAAATSGAAGGSSAGTTAGATTTSGGSSPTTSPSSGSGSSSSRSAGSSGASSGTNTATGANASGSNAALPNAQIGAAGVIGAAVLALLS